MTRPCPACGRPVSRGGGPRSGLHAEHLLGGRRCGGSDVPWGATVVRPRPSAFRTVLAKLRPGPRSVTPLRRGEAA